MPILGLNCNQCKREFEFFKLKSDEVPECPFCGSKDHEPLPPKNTSAKFVGPGFHVNDYGKRGRKR